MIFRVFQRHGGRLASSSFPSKLLMQQKKAPPSYQFCLQQYSTSQWAAMPLKAVEVLSLGDASSSSSAAKKFKLLETPLLKGSFVEQGDIVGIVQQDENNDSSKTFEIPSPSTGRLVQVHMQVGDEIQVGDTLVTIDTDAVENAAQNATSHNASNATTTTTEPENAHVKELILHLQETRGELSDAHVQQLCKTITDIESLRAIASLLTERFPNTPLQMKALPFLETVLLRQQGQNSDNSQELLLEQATTHTDLGILLYRLGDLEAALTQLECALQQRKEALGGSHPELSATLIHIGAIKNQKNDLDGCFDAFSEAMTIQKEHLGDSHPLVAASLNNLGAICYHKGDFPKAIPYYQQALDIYRKQENGEQSSDTAGSYNNLAVAMKHTGDVTAAIDYCRKALTIRQTTLGVRHIDTATSHYCLGQIFSETRQYEAALEQLETALDIQTEHYGTPHHPTPATTHNHMGAIHYEQGEFQKALDSYQLALDAFSAALGNDVPQVADCHNNVGMSQAKLQQFDDALVSHEAAKQILEAKFGATHPTLAMTLANIGSVLKSKGHYDDALQHYRQSHPMLEATLGADHDMVGSSYNNMGQVLAMQGKLDDALTVYRAALNIFQKTLSEDHVFTGSIHYNIGLVLQQQSNKNEESKESYQRAYDIWRAALGPEHGQTIMAEQAMDQLGVVSGKAATSTERSD
ncbi:Involved in proper cytoplasmic distribution of mitochondria (By similarity) [Seminavis robusta]|uniref:Involved in proper cytoplasmic distribution of mitochondria By similarity n=1 Tax=Seminavis robusta TaxID=568900 RepID=A0A9N8E821_9STRA|nr:Involved in proper cytoplasmic distribution of mitochondria (By similarity) [Seminavis robusta]|eukprot:Sro650_g181360.1 Involved in proper cytoplasmic distribution of mitochondria (By similarity) (694) ;mRNA; f:12441-14522